MPAEDIVFTRHDDYSVTVDRFPEQIEISPELLGQALMYIETRIEFKMANGTAVYLVMGYRGGPGVEGALSARLLSATMAEPK